MAMTLQFLVQHSASVRGARVTGLGRMVNAAIGTADSAHLSLLRYPRFGHDTMRPDHDRDDWRSKALIVSRAGRFARRAGVLSRTARSAAGAILSGWFQPAEPDRDSCSCSVGSVNLSTVSKSTNPRRGSEGDPRGEWTYESRARAR